MAWSQKTFDRPLWTGGDHFHLWHCTLNFDRLTPKNSLSFYILYFCCDVLSCTSLVIRTCSHYVSELGISVQWFPSWAGSKLDFVDRELWSWIICFSGTTSGGDICSISFSSSKCSRIIYFPVTRFQVASICPKTILPNLSKPKVLVKSTKTGYSR